MESRDELIYRARLAEQGERYKDMIEAMKSVAQVSHTLNRFTLNLHSCCSKDNYRVKNGICCRLLIRTKSARVVAHGAPSLRSRTKRNTKAQSILTLLSSIERK